MLDEIISIEEISSRDKYDLEIEETNCFFANGILVHNCRCIVTKDCMFSRSWKPIVSAPHIHDDLKDLLEMGYIFDAELYNHDFKADFNKIISLARKTKPTQEDLIESKEKLQCWIFDLVDKNSNFSQRSETLNNMVLPKSCVLVDTVHVLNRNELDELNDQYILDGFEGQMIRFDREYEFTRSKFLEKRKSFLDEEFQIVALNEGTGNWSGMIKTVTCLTKDGKEFKATIKNNQEYCTELMTDPNRFVGGEVTVRYQNLTPEEGSSKGVPRFPVAITLYEGKRDL